MDVKIDKSKMLFLKFPVHCAFLLGFFFSYGNRFMASGLVLSYSCMINVCVSSSLQRIINICFYYKSIYHSKSVVPRRQSSSPCCPCYWEKFQKEPSFLFQVPAMTSKIVFKILTISPISRSAHYHHEQLLADLSRGV